ERNAPGGLSQDPARPSLGGTRKQAIRQPCPRSTTFRSLTCAGQWDAEERERERAIVRWRHARPIGGICRLWETQTECQSKIHRVAFMPRLDLTGTTRDAL